MTTFREQYEKARASGDWQACVSLVPYANWLGIRANEADGELGLRLEYSEQNVGNASLPALHGGTLGALLESAAVFEILYRAESTLIPKTITLTVDYLRPARPVDTYARALIVRHGRRVATVRCEAWQDDRNKPVAIATAHLLVLSEEPASPSVTSTEPSAGPTTAPEALP